MVALRGLFNANWYRAATQLTTVLNTGRRMRASRARPGGFVQRTQGEAGEPRAHPAASFSAPGGGGRAARVPGGFVQRSWGGGLDARAPGFKGGQNV